MAHRTPSWAPIMNSLARCQIQCITAGPRVGLVRALITRRECHRLVCLRHRRAARHRVCGWRRVARWGAVQPPGGQLGEVNVHVAWRMAVASRAARAYAGNGKLAALAVAGSVGAGLADRFSDLELDCYWSSPPGDADRTGPIDALGGELTGFWEYDEDDHEWSEDYRLGDLGVTVSNFLASTVERFLGDVVLRADTGPVKHMRLAALQRSRPLLG